jgi:hemoglobin/transferrin/lactoferrin receptor protein
MWFAAVPPYRARATTGFRFLQNNALSIGARFTAVGASRRTCRRARPSRRGYGPVDLFASLSYNDYVSDNLPINNLFNREYAQFLSSDRTPGAVIKAGLTIKFRAR